jgi:hypothetical protein
MTTSKGFGKARESVAKKKKPEKLNETAINVVNKPFIPGFIFDSSILF